MAEEKQTGFDESRLTNFCERLGEEFANKQLERCRKLFAEFGPSPYNSSVEKSGRFETDHDLLEACYQTKVTITNLASYGRHGDRYSYAFGPTRTERKKQLVHELEELDKDA